MIYQPIFARYVSFLVWLGLSFNKVESIFRANTVDRTCLAAECNTIALVCNMNNLGSESGANELRASLVGDGLEKRSNSSTVLRIQIGINFVEDNHGAAFSLLQRKDEAESTQTWRILELAGDITDILGLCRRVLQRYDTYSFDHH
jgi:hypothetical protein